MSKRTLLKAVCCVLSLMVFIGSLPLMSAFSAAAKDVAQADIESAVNENSGFNPYDISIDPDSSEYPLVEGYKTIVFDARDWTQAYAYCWQKGTGDAPAEWPGTPMKKVTDDNGYGMKRYVAYIPPEYDMYIINNGNVGAGNMTVDLEISESIGIYMDGTDTSGNCTVGYWEPNFYYYEFSTDAATTQAVKPTQTAPPSCEIIVYYENTEDWSQVYCHVWSDSGATTTWPGILMEYVGNNIFKADIGNEYTSVIFHDGSTDADCMSPDLYIPGDNMLYSNGCWYEYVESPTDTTENPDPTEIIVEVDSKVVTWNDGSYNYHAFKAEVAGGTAPYTYQFFLGDLDITSDINSNEASVCIGEYGEYYAEVIVTDSLGNSSSAIVVINFDEHQEETTSTEETTPVEETYTLYFRNHDKWNIVNAYTWCDGYDFSQPLGMWPGTACKYIDGDIWAIEVTDNFDYIIFNDAGRQSSILPNPGGFNIARWVSTDGNESEYEWEFPIITKPTEATEPSEVPADDIKVYFDNGESYNQVFVYAWGEEDYGEISQWPGVLCTDEKDGTWSVVIPGTCDYVVFHNGKGIQTNDLVNPEESKIAKVVRVEDGLDVYDWFDVEEITTTVTEPTEQITTEARPHPTEITTAATETTITTEPLKGDYLLGDANLDGKVNIFDVTLIDKYTIDSGVFGDNPVALKAADFNENTVVNFMDAIALQEYLASEREIKPEFSGADADGVNIDGKNYPVVRGGIYTYNLFIDTPKSIENIQAYVAYDAEKLRLIDEYGSIDYPLLVSCKEGKKEGLIAFNFSTVSDRYNFAGGKILVKLQFKVLDSSASEIVAVIENMAEYGGSIYYEDGEKKNDDVKVYHTFEPDYVPSESEYALGDVDRDGKISIFDATAIQKYIAMIAGMLDEEYRYLADVNLDNSINIKDASVIQKYLALLIAIEDNREIVPEFAGATEDGVNIDGKNYKVEVGDIVTYSFCLKTPKAVENIQAYVAYDADKLRPVRDVNSENCPDLMGGLLNAVDGLIVFNATEITRGYDFRNGKVVLEVQFEVLDSSASEIVAVIENMAEFFGEVYFEDCEKKNDGVKVSHIFELDFRPTEPATEDELEPETSESTEPTTATEATETTVTEPTTTVPAEPEFETGDVNCDGKLNIKDVTAIQKFLAKLIDFAEEVKMLADYNGDGLINIKDATTIQKKLANLI